MIRVRCKSAFSVTMSPKGLVPIVIRPTDGIVEVPDDYHESVLNLYKMDKLDCVDDIESCIKESSIKTKKESQAMAARRFGNEPNGGIYRESFKDALAPDEFQRQYQQKPAPGPYTGIIGAPYTGPEVSDPASLEQALIDVSPDIVQVVCDWVSRRDDTREVPPALRSIVEGNSSARNEFVSALARRGVMSRLMKVVVAKARMRTKGVKDAEYRKSMIYKMRKDIEKFSLLDNDGMVRISVKDLDKLKDGIKDMAETSREAMRGISGMRTKFSNARLQPFLTKETHETNNMNGSTEITRTYVLPRNYLLNETGDIEKVNLTDGTSTTDGLYDYQKKVLDDISTGIGIPPESFKSMDWAAGHPEIGEDDL